MVPGPANPSSRWCLVEDNGPIHTRKLSLAALAARAHWLTVEWLPKYAPELNDIEPVWRDLKAHHLAHQTFADPDALDQGIHQAVAALNAERTPLPLAKPRISALGMTAFGVRANRPPLSPSGAILPDPPSFRAPSFLDDRRPPPAPRKLLVLSYPLIP